MNNEIYDTIFLGGDLMNNDDYVLESFISFCDDIYIHENHTIVQEGFFKNVGKTLWTEIKNFVRNLITWFKKLLLNINYFRNAVLDEKLNNDLISTLRLSQPRTEFNFGIINKIFSLKYLFKAVKGFNDDEMNMSDPKVQMTFSGSQPIMLSLSEEVDNCIDDLDNTMEAVEDSAEYKRIQEDNYSNSQIKTVPLTFITQDMKNTLSSLTKFQNTIDRVNNIDASTANSSGQKLINRMIVFCRKTIGYYTFRQNVLTKYFKKAKASIKAVGNNIKEAFNKDTDSRTRNSTKHSKYKFKFLNRSNPKVENIEDLATRCRMCKTYDEYLPLFNQLQQLLGIHADVIILPGPFDITPQYIVTYIDERTKVPLNGRTLYHTSQFRIRNIRELSPRWVSNGGELFSTPRVYLHVGVALDRFGAKIGSHFHSPESSTLFVVKDKISYGYKDPEMGGTAIYVETNNPIRVEPIDYNKLYKNRDNKIDSILS